MNARSGADLGFTLVEALVSLFVFSLISAGAVAMLMQSVESQRRVVAAQEAVRELQSARATFAADMAQMVERSVREPDDTRRPHFLGGDETLALSFVRIAAEPDGDGGAASALALVEYRFEDAGVVRASRGVLDPRTEAAMSERILIAEAAAARFEFFDGAAWRPQWSARTQGAAPPRAVALVFTSPRYGEVRLEALVRAAP